MLRDAIEQCPDDLWTANGHVSAYWQVAYHTLFYTHLYMHTDEASVRPWAQHQNEVQHPGGLTNPAKADSRLPLLPKPYSKAQVLEFWDVCDRMVDEAVEAIDLDRTECGFWWYKMSKLEHQFVNIRHIQHHTAQLADRLRSAADRGVKWVGARRSA